MTDDAADDDFFPGLSPRVLRKFLGLQVVLLIPSAILPAQDLDLITCQLMFGLVISQGVLAGAWLTLGPGNLTFRFIAAPLWVTVAAAVGGIIQRPHDAFQILLIIAAGASLMIACLLFTIRLLFGWRLGTTNDSASLPLQYGLKHLMILTAVVSVFAAVVAGVKEPLPILFLTGIGGIFAMGLISSVVVPLLPASRGWLMGGLIFAAGTAFLASLGIGLGLRQESDFLFGGDFYVQILVIGMTAFVAVTFSMLTIRAAGYRLARSRSH